MRKILKIAKLELSILFYAPVAWLILVIFTVQCGMTFLDHLQTTNTTLLLGYSVRPITGSLFGGQSGLFAAIQSYLYLYLPLLTMGLMSRETSSGSIKLLLSSPVKLREIILGKYLAIIGYGFVMVLIMAAFGLIGVVSIAHADVGRILSGLFGLYLLICTYAAIGLFMSCLTTYQVVAAISTLAVFSALRFVGTLGQDIDFIRDLTYFLSISGRTDTMIQGLITSRDVLYYLIIICTFILLCILRLKGERERKSGSVKAGRYAMLVTVALLFGYVSSRPEMIAYLDVTSAKSLTLTENAQEIAKEIKGELKVTTYANMLAPRIWHFLPQSRNMDLDRMEAVKRFIPGMDFKYLYYYRQPLDSNFADYRFNPQLKNVKNVDRIADQMATSMDIDRKLFMSPEEMDKLQDLRPEGYLNVRKLEYNGKSTFLSFYVGSDEQDPYPDEAEVMAAVKRLLVKAPKVVFVTGNQERSVSDRSDRGYEMIGSRKTRRLALLNQGFEVDTININIADVPADADILVLADPASTLDAGARARLSAYVEKGGNMLVTGDPERREKLNPVLADFGAQLRAGTVVTADRKFAPGFISTLVNKKSATLDSNLNRMSRWEISVAMQGAGVLDHKPESGFTAVPVLMAPARSWNKLAPIDPTAAALRYNTGEGDQQGEFPLSMALTRKLNGKEQRILISGDADFMSNGELSRGRRGENEYYMRGVFRWLSNGKFPIDVTRPEPKDMSLHVDRDQISFMKYIFIGLIPALIAVFGAVLLFKRRRN